MMAYDTDELERAALDAITKHKLKSFNEIPPFIGISERTFYNHELHKLQSIKEAIQDSKVRLAVTLRKKWLMSENSTLQMGLMKLVCSDEDLKRLSTNFSKTDGNHNINVTSLSEEQLNKIIEQGYQNLE